MSTETTETRTAGKVETYAKAVAKALNDLYGTNWCAVQTEHGTWDLRSATMPSAGGLELDTWTAARLHFRRQWNDPGRVTVDGRGSLYQLRYFDAERREYVGESVMLTDDEDRALRPLTSSLDGDPVKMARRLGKYIGDYIPILRSRVERQRQAEADLVSNAETAERLVRKLGGYTRGVDYRGATIYPGVQEIRRISVEGDRTEIEMRIPTDKLEEILTALGYEA